MGQPAASVILAAVTPAPRAATTEVNDSGRWLFAITTCRPARSAVRANACPARPAPMMPIVSIRAVADADWTIS
jgi:hypothetical protein